MDPILPLLLIIIILIFIIITFFILIIPLELFCEGRYGVWCRLAHFPHHIQSRLIAPICSYPVRFNLALHRKLGGDVVFLCVHSSTKSEQTVSLLIDKLLYIWIRVHSIQRSAGIFLRHCQRHNRPKALSTLTHSTTLLQSRSFNKLWSLCQTLAGFCLVKGGKYIKQLWQIHVTTLTNPCSSFEKSI